MASDSDLQDKVQACDRICFKVDGRDCVRDIARNSLVQLTVEESVRQDVIQFCIDELGWPLDLISSEYPLSRTKQSKDRADIVLWRPCAEGECTTLKHALGIPFLVIECKAEQVILSDDTADQASRYAKQLGAGYFVTTNRRETRSYRVTIGGRPPYARISRIPRFGEVLQGSHDKIEEFTPPHKVGQFDWEDLSNPGWLRNKWAELQAGNLVSRRTPENVRRTTLDLMSLLMGRPMRAATGLPWAWQGYTIREDWGISLRVFGHAAGSDLWGQYRVFLVERPNGSLFLLNLTIFDMGEYVNHPAYGNRKGKSVLMACIGDNEDHNASLELSIDKFFSPRGSAIEVWHDFAMTAKTRLKNEIVYDHIRSEAPYLLASGPKVALGTILANSPLDWEKLNPFLVRLAIYADVRNKLRARIKAERAANEG